MWLERAIGPLPGEKEGRAFGICGIAIALIACGLSLYYGFKGEAFLGRPMGGDFVQFYAAGRVLNQHEPTKLFDPPYFSAVQHEILPTMASTQWLIFGNPPCIAALFRPLALLTYRQAYCVWLVFSAALYISGLLILLHGRWGSTAVLLALSTPMFTLETWIGGQVSVFGFFLFAICVRCFESQRYFLAGLALGLTAYKPSLLVIPAAMFLAGRCWKMVAGISISASFVVAACFAAAGIDGMRLWLNTLRVFQYLISEEQSILRRSKYVDLNSFLVVLGGLNNITKTIAFVIVAAALVVLAWSWFRSQGDRKMLFAATIAATLILNFYVPVYDTPVLIPALVLVAATLGDNKELRVWILLFALVPWLTQSAADFLHVQILTIAIAGFSYWVFKRRDCGRPERSLR
jgi:Glycosyltransferase family 87